MRSFWDEMSSRDVSGKYRALSNGDKNVQSAKPGVNTPDQRQVEGVKDKLSDAAPPIRFEFAGAKKSAPKPNEKKKLEAEMSQGLLASSQ